LFEFTRKLLNEKFPTDEKRPTDKKTDGKTIKGKTIQFFRIIYLAFVYAINLSSNISFRRNPFEIQDNALTQKRSRPGGMTFL